MLWRSLDALKIQNIPSHISKLEDIYVCTYRRQQYYAYFKRNKHCPLPLTNAYIWKVLEGKFKIFLTKLRIFQNYFRIFHFKIKILYLKFTNFPIFLSWTWVPVLCVRRSSSFEASHIKFINAFNVPPIWDFISV